MSDIVNNLNETDKIIESVARSRSFAGYGVLGTEPLAPFPKRRNVMLRDAVAANWDSVTASPSASEVRFLTTWFDDGADFELIFLPNSYSKPAVRGMRSTDWRLQQVSEFIDVHVFCRSAGGDEEPATVGLLEDALEAVIETNSTTLIPNAHVTLERVVAAPEPNPDDLKTLYHDVATCQVAYWKRLL
jgi:hypothetical protein